MVSNDLILLKHFQCKWLVGLLVINKPNLSKRSYTQDSNLLHILKLKCAIQLG